MQRAYSVCVVTLNIDEICNNKKTNTSEKDWKILQKCVTDYNNNNKKKRSKVQCNFDTELLYGRIHRIKAERINIACTLTGNVEIKHIQQRKKNIFEPKKLSNYSGMKCNSVKFGIRAPFRKEWKKQVVELRKNYWKSWDAICSFGTVFVAAPSNFRCF